MLNLIISSCPRLFLRNINLFHFPISDIMRFSLKYASTSVLNWIKFSLNWVPSIRPYWLRKNVLRVCKNLDVNESLNNRFSRFHSLSWRKIHWYIYIIVFVKIFTIWWEVEKINSFFLYSPYKITFTLWQIRTADDFNVAQHVPDEHV